MGVAYIRSTPGILKLITLLFNMIGFICILATGISPRGDAFIAATVMGFIFTCLILIIRVLDLDQKINLPWMKVEFIYCLIWAVFVLITAALVIDVGAAGYIAGGVFGLFSTLTYLIDAYDKFTSGL